MFFFNVLRERCQKLDTFCFLARASGVFVRSLPGMRNGMEWWIEVETNKKQLSELQKLAKIELFPWAKPSWITTLLGVVVFGDSACWDPHLHFRVVRSRDQEGVFFVEETSLSSWVFGAQRAVLCLFQPQFIIPYRCACRGDRKGTSEARAKKYKNVQFLTPFIRIE